MAKVDVNAYFLQVQEQYIKMRRIIDDFNEELKEKRVTQEHYDKVKRQYELIENNYERLAYFMMLLNQPKKKKGKERDAREHRKLYDRLKCASKEAILDENKNALIELKQLVEDFKKDEY